MLKNLSIPADKILERLKISCQLSSVVRDAVSHQIIIDAARREGIVVTDLELQQAADRFRIQYNLYNPETTWNWLQTNYLSGDDFEQLICESIVTTKLIENLFSDRVKPYFYEHQLDYTQAVLYKVVFDDFDTAIEIFYALQEQEISFIEVARQHIQQPDLRRQHGYQGILSRPELNSAISAAVFAATPPQILKPIEIGKKTHLILVEEIIEPQLNESLRSKILGELFSAWLEKQLQQYSIEVTKPEVSSEVCRT